jgi:hypothetical protein
VIIDKYFVHIEYHTCGAVVGSSGAYSADGRTCIDIEGVIEDGVHSAICNVLAALLAVNTFRATRLG